MLSEYNQARDDKNKLIDECILLIKKNASKKKLFEKQLELQYAEEHLARVKKKRISLLQKLVNKLKSMTLC